MKDLKNHQFTLESGLIQIPSLWHTIKLKKPNIFYYDNNRSFAYIQAMKIAIAEYNRILNTLSEPINTDEVSLLNFNQLIEKAEQIRNIYQRYHYQPADTGSGTLSWLRRTAYELFYPTSTAMTYHSLPLLDLIDKQIIGKQQKIEEALYTAHHDALLEGLSFNQAPVKTKAPFQAFKQYEKILQKHKKTWNNPVFQTACHEVKLTLKWLGTASLKQKCEAWIDTRPGINADTQQLYNIAKCLSVSIEIQTETIVKKAQAVLSDWGTWAKQKIKQIGGLAPKADDLGFIFTPTQATSARHVSDVYSVIKETVKTAKAEHDKVLHSRLDALEAKAQRYMGASINRPML